MPPPFETLNQLCADATERFADRPLFGTRGASGWSWTTYRAFGDLVDRVRGGLAARGISEGSAVAIVADNCVEWAALFYAAAGLGASTVPLYPAQAPDEWAFVLKDSGSRLVVCATDQIAEALRAFEIDGLEHIVPLGEWEALASADPVPAIAPDPDTRVSLIYTSGTTGVPKGVELSHRNQCSNVNALHALFDLTDQTSLSFLPWAHSFGQTAELHTLLSMGNAIAINDRIPNLTRNLLEVKPTVLIAVPRLFERIRDSVAARVYERSVLVQSLFASGLDAAWRQHRGEALGPFDSAALWMADRQLFAGIRDRLGGRLTTAISGSAALDPEVARFFIALGIDVYEGYGLTETGPIAAVNTPTARKLGTVGRPLPGVRIEIDTQASGDDVDGELIVHGPNVMLGYHGRPEETAAITTDDGGLRTGDLGHIDADGFVTITGRLREQFKLTNGRFVVPVPIEAAIRRSPYVAHCIVEGRNRPHTVALLVPDEEAIRSWARDNGLGRVNVETNDRVRALLQAEVQERTQQFKPWERPTAFAITATEFTPQNGLLTPTLKLRRREALSRFTRMLDALYS